MVLVQKIFVISIIVFAVAACKKDVDPIVAVAASNGAEVQLNGLIGNEPGSAAGNTVYLDLSSNKTTAIPRHSWDLGFYCGADFRVIINNTTSAGAKVLTKNDLTKVTATDTIGLTLATSHANPLPEQLAYFDDYTGDLNKTVVPAVSATDAANLVIILNRGMGGDIPPRPWIKFRVLRNGNGGYTLQYAGITEVSFKTLQIPKDPSYNFKYVSFDKGITTVEPPKDKWDLAWTYSVYRTNVGPVAIPYNFSDLIAINFLAGVKAAEKKYADAVTANAAFDAFNKDSLATANMTNNRWVIGSNWRSTQPATGVKTDRFYIVKDPNNNYYKLKCLDMGVNDGGIRGKPRFKYH